MKRFIWIDHEGEFCEFVLKFGEYSKQLNEFRIGSVSFGFLLNDATIMDASCDDNFMKLEILDFSGAFTLHDESLCMLFKQCPNLNSFEFRCFNSHIITVTIEALVTNCPKLKYVCIENCRMLTNDCLHVFLDGCPLLTTLSIFNCNLCEMLYESVCYQIFESSLH